MLSEWTIKFYCLKQTMCLQIIKVTREQPKQWTNYWMKEKQPLDESQPPRSSSRTRAHGPHPDILFSHQLKNITVRYQLWFLVHPSCRLFSSLNDFMLRRYFWPLITGALMWWSRIARHSHSGSQRLWCRRSYLNLPLSTTTPHPPSSRTLMHPPGLVISGLERLTCDWKVG